MSSRLSFIFACFFFWITGCVSRLPDHPDPSMSLQNAEQEIRILLPGARTLNTGTVYVDRKSGVSIKKKSIRFTTDSIVFIDDIEGELSFSIVDIEPGIMGNMATLKGGAWSKTWVAFSSDQEARRFANALLVLKAHRLEIKDISEKKAGFDRVVRLYLATDPKPEIPEEVRRFAVQADAAVKEKHFAEAADLYSQALDLAPWWPAGHYNRAYILSEINEYEDAVAEMQAYLMLVPDDSKRREIQDVIYIWQGKIH